MLKKSFEIFVLKNGCLAESCDKQFPTSLYSWQKKSLQLPANGTHFGFVFSGEANLRTKYGDFILREKMYFCVPDAFSIEGGKGIIVTRNDYRGIFNLGGAIEENGRLRYIDGCRDTLLIPPLLKGEPCLNALYFPSNITQTPHTHPSVRVGIVAEGSGECVTPDGKFDLQAGSAFVIAPDALHSFNTRDEKMIVIAYHPDSDFGATHENHPMINRTIVEGVSAANLENIRTK